MSVVALIATNSFASREPCALSAALLDLIFALVANRPRPSAVVLVHFPIKLVMAFAVFAAAHEYPRGPEPT